MFVPGMVPALKDPRVVSCSSGTLQTAAAPVLEDLPLCGTHLTDSTSTHGQEHMSFYEAVRARLWSAASREVELKGPQAAAQPPITSFVPQCLGDNEHEATCVQMMLLARL